MYLWLVSKREGLCNYFGFNISNKETKLLWLEKKAREGEWKRRISSNFFTDQLFSETEQTGG